MGSQNQLSRYGAISKIIQDLAPSAKVFLVGDTDDTTYGIQNLASDFPVDNNGVVRVYSTIQAANNAASPNRGDVILVAPGYDYTLQRADSWNTAGVQIIGMGASYNKPLIRVADTGSTIELSANGVKVEGLRFMADTSGITRCIDMDTGFGGQEVKNCEFTFGETGDDFITVIRCGAKRSIIENNRIEMENAAGHNYAISLLGGDPDYTIIRNNFISGNFDVAVIGQDTSDTSDTNLTGIQILNNTIINCDTASAQHIKFSAGYTIRGLVAGNRIASYDTSTADTAQVTAGGARFIDNIIRSDSTEKTTP